MNDDDAKKGFVKIKMPTYYIAKHSDDDIQEYKRPWVGLSDTEAAIYGNQFSGIRLVREIEAVLKERNNG